MGNEWDFCVPLFQLNILCCHVSPSAVAHLSIALSVLFGTWVRARRASDSVTMCFASTSPFKSLFFLLLLVLPAVAADGRQANCSSFATDGLAAAQFDYYRFYDFRNISSSTWSEDEDPRDADNVTAGASTSDMSWQLDWLRRDFMREPPSNLSYFLLPIDYQAEKVQVGENALRGLTDDSMLTSHGRQSRGCT